MSTFQPARNIDDAWSAVDVFPLKPGDPRYIDCSPVRGDTLSRIRRMLTRHVSAGRDLHLLFTGYRGNGKTTELFQLQSKIKHEYEVIYCDAAKSLDVNNLALSELLAAIAKETVDGMKQAGYHLPDKLLEDVGDWFFEKILKKSEGIAAEIGAKADIGIPAWMSAIVAKVYGSFKISTDTREEMRRTLEQHITELLEKVNALLEAAREQAKQNRKKDMLFILDSLDRLKSGLDRSLFLLSGDQLKGLHGHFIYVVPISLLYNEQASLLPFDEQLSMPMLPIYKHGTDRHEHAVGIAHLRELLNKRLIFEEIFTEPEGTVHRLILASGGHLRDLMKLISIACNETDSKITPQYAEIAINQLVEDYKKVVRDEEYAQIVKVYQTQDTDNNNLNQKLTYNNVILVYRDPDGSEWKDVHPAVVRNNKFQQVLREDE